MAILNLRDSWKRPVFKLSGYGLLVLLGLLPVTAEASHGTLSGHMYFHNRNGGYCPNSEPCVGASYEEDDWNTAIGILGAMIEIRRSTTNTTIASGTLDASGFYHLGWSYGGGTSGMNAKIRIYFRQKDGRFQFHTLGSSHSQLTAYSPTFTLQHGTAEFQPQVYSYVFGSASSPNAVANAYWGTWWRWDKRLRYSGRMLAYLDDVDILAFDTGRVACSGSSCARGYYERMSSPPSWAEKMKTIVLGDGDYVPYSYESHMHEMGHIADYVSGPNQGLIRSTGYQDGKWSMNSEEYRPTALTEALASYIAVSALYYEIATNPRTCKPDGNDDELKRRHCYASGSTTVQNYSIEQSNHGSCGSKEGRWALSHVRYFWDITDSCNDGLDTLNSSQYAIFDAQAAYPCPN